MNKYVLLILVLISVQGFAQKSTFCYQERESDATSAVASVSNKSSVTIQFDNFHEIIIAEDQKGRAKNIVKKYELTKAGKYSKLGMIICTKVSGKDADGYGEESDQKNKSVTVWYNGKFMFLEFHNDENATGGILEKQFYIPKKCIGDLLKSL
jgi:hypothetical protein